MTALSPGIMGDSVQAPLVIFALMLLALAIRPRLPRVRLNLPAFLVTAGACALLAQLFRLVAE